MNRRGFILGLGSAAVVGGGAVVVFGQGFEDEDTLSPVTVEVIDAPQSSLSSGDRLQLPSSETVAVIDLFSTTCVACDDQIDTLETVRQSVSNDVRFISITNQTFSSHFTRPQLREWWKTHGGEWPVGHDPDGQLIRSFNASALPYTAVVDSSGTIHLGKRGVLDPQTIISAVQGVTEA